MQIFQQSEYNKSTKSLAKVDNNCTCCHFQREFKVTEIARRSPTLARIVFHHNCSGDKFLFAMKNYQSQSTNTGNARRVWCSKAEVDPTQLPATKHASFKRLHLNTDSKVRGMLWTDEAKDMESQVSYLTIVTGNVWRCTSHGFNSDRSVATVMLKMWLIKELNQPINRCTWVQ